MIETFKWRQPVYAHGGGNVAILWNFKESCGLGFFKGALLSDPAGRLVAPGPNSRAARKLPFTSLSQIATDEALIRAYLAEAIALQESGARVAMPKDDLDEPPELTQALAADPALATAFRALTPGRQRGYILHFAGAKQAETRARRIAKHRDRILAGFGLHDR